jgi:hypothetical protein
MVLPDAALGARGPLQGGPYAAFDIRGQDRCQASTQKAGQCLALAPDVWHRGHFPEQRLRDWPDGLEPLPDFTLAIVQRADRADIEPEPQQVGSDIAAIEQSADQRVGDPVVIAARTGAVDHALHL